MSLDDSNIANPNAPKRIAMVIANPAVSTRSARSLMAGTFRAKIARRHVATRR